MSKKHLLGPILGAITVLCWSSYNVAAKQGIDTGMPPAELALLRFAVPGVLALPILAVWVHRGQTPEMPPYRLFVLVLLGGPLFGLAAVSGYVHAPLSHGLLFAPVAVFLSTGILGGILLHEHVRKQRLWAAAVMFGGLAILVGFDVSSLDSAWSQGAEFFMLAGCMWGGYTVLLRYWEIPTVYGAVCVAAGSALAALPILGPGATNGLQQASFVDLALQTVMQGIVGGVISVLAMIGAVRAFPIYASAALPVFTPVVALCLVLVFYGSVPSTAEVTGVAVVSAGFLMGLGISVPKHWSKVLANTHR